MRAPWVIVPLLLVCVFVGWRAKGAQDDGEIRGLKAENKGLGVDKEAAETRLKLAQDKQQATTRQLEVLEPFARKSESEIAALKIKVAQIESELSERVKAILLPELEKIASNNTVVATSVHNLSAANLEVGAALAGLGGLHVSIDVPQPLTNTGRSSD
jgi:hypothetical protein